MSVRHPLAARKETGLADLAGEKWVMPDADDSGMNTYVARTCAAAGFDQRISHLTNEAHVAFALAAALRGICLLYPIGTMREGLATLSLAGTLLYRELVLAWRVDSPVAPLVPALCATIADGYLALVEKASFYRDWWRAGGAVFALP